MQDRHKIKLLELPSLCLSQAELKHCDLNHLRCSGFKAPLKGLPVGSMLIFQLSPNRQSMHALLSFSSTRVGVPFSETQQHGCCSLWFSFNHPPPQKKKNTGTLKKDKPILRTQERNESRASQTRSAQKTLTDNIYIVIDVLLLGLRLMLRWWARNLNLRGSQIVRDPKTKKQRNT